MDSRRASAEAFSMPETTRPLREQLRRFKDTDLTIICGDREWSVHEARFCARSAFFENTCTGSVLEGQQKVVNLPDDHPDVVDALVYFIYFSNYPGAVEEPNIAINRLLFDVRVFNIANKCLVENLKRVAATNFERKCAHQWHEPVFFRAIEEVYESGLADLRLRLAVVATIKMHQDNFLNSQAARFNRFHGIMRKYPNLAVDLMVYLSPMVQKRCLKCTGCNRIAVPSGPDDEDLVEWKSVYCTVCEWQGRRAFV